MDVHIPAHSVYSWLSAGQVRGMITGASVESKSNVGRDETHLHLNNVRIPRKNYKGELNRGEGN